ncbi:hypothetical protein ACFOPQ_05220 [Deinococcus antarcticus]|uniref:Uncharacterized protein n=1 Tax=Deinococcus antarcticus TaxID=1298767 RepID=A0ABV8A3Z4_9DEIO
MQAQTIPQHQWPLCEQLVISAVKIIGQLGMEDEMARSMVQEQAELLHAGLGQLLTRKQYQVAALRATRIVDELVALETDHQMTFLALLAQSAFQYVQPGTLEDVASNLAATLLTTPLSVAILEGPNKPLPTPKQPEPLTRRDKMLLFVLGFIGSSLSSGVPLHPVVLAQLRQVRQFFAEQQEPASRLSQRHQEALEAALQGFQEPFPAEVPLTHHWHHLTCAAIAPTLSEYRSDRPSAFVDSIILRALDARMGLAQAATVTLH